MKKSNSLNFNEIWKTSYFIFIDFEKNMKGDFHIIGIAAEEYLNIFPEEKREDVGLYDYVGGERFDLVQGILNEKLKKAAEAKNMMCLSTASLIEWLAELHEKEHICIVAYSIAEAEAISSIADYEFWEHGFPADNLYDIPYLNLLNAAKKWVRKHYKGKLEAMGPGKKLKKGERYSKYSLPSVMRLTDYQATQGHAAGKTMQKINTVIDALERKGCWEDLTARQKSKFTQVLNHNRWDVIAMIELFQQIYSEDKTRFNYSVKKMKDWLK